MKNNDIVTIPNTLDAEQLLSLLCLPPLSRHMREDGRAVGPLVVNSKSQNLDRETSGRNPERTPQP